MFEYLNGKIEYKKLEYIALDVSGVGYKIYISLKTYDKVKVEEIKRLYIYNHIKEDSFKLIGFLEEKERSMFEMLLSVSGIGVALALSILSSFEIDEIKTAIGEDDFKSLKKVPKLGEKKAKQIILDLKGKIDSLDLIYTGKGTLFERVDNSKQIMEELYLALESLGYSKKEIESLVKRDEIKEFESTEDAVKFILKKIRDKK